MNRLFLFSPSCAPTLTSPCTRKYWIDKINSQLNVLWSLQLLYSFCLPTFSLWCKSCSCSPPHVRFALPACSPMPSSYPSLTSSVFSRCISLMSTLLPTTAPQEVIYFFPCLVISSVRKDDKLTPTASDVFFSVLYIMDKLALRVTFAPSCTTW